MKNHGIRNKCKVLAFDLGASNGRGILAGFDGKRIRLREMHRFANSYSLLGGRAYWDLLWLIDNIKQGISLCSKARPESLGIDAWGVDFGLLDRTGGLLSLPRSYRDNAFSKENMTEALIFLGGASWLFQQTYLANWEINPVFKFYHLKKTGEESLEAADTFLMIPNLIEYFLTGVKHSEYTIAATSQLFNMKDKVWAKVLLEKLALPETLFTTVDHAGSIIGRLLPSVEREIGRSLRVVSVASHDTASAALAAPSRNQDFTFISSGTWSLMCSRSEYPLEDERSIHNGISNEGNWDGACRPTINISGLWILQECQKQWKKAGLPYSYDEILAMAEKEQPLRSMIRPDDFEKPGDYPAIIQKYCQKTGQLVPENTGQIVRCILESLALKYRQAYDTMRSHIRCDEAVYIVGGGVRNRMLNQFTANALHIPVITGPAEAAAIGNILIQLEALGELSGREDRSEVVRCSFESETFLPQNRDCWEEAWERFQELYHQ